MAGRGMLFAEGPTACPFVALESDRDRRAGEPDPRHRCYAEPMPAPRALAHQREFCLSPTFPGCPIFQDWAVRAAARPVPLRPLATPPGDPSPEEVSQEQASPSAPQHPAGPQDPAGPQQLPAFDPGADERGFDDFQPPHPGQGAEPQPAAEKPPAGDALPSPPLIPPPSAGDAEREPAAGRSLDPQPIERLPSLPPEPEDERRQADDPGGPERQPGASGAPPASGDRPASGPQAASGPPPPVSGPRPASGTPPSPVDPPASGTPPGDLAARRRWTEDWPPSAAASAAAAANAVGASAGSGGPADGAPPDPAQSEGSSRLARPTSQVEVGRPLRFPRGRRDAPSPRDEWSAQRADLIPAWERQRHTSYPGLRTRVGLGDGDALLSRLTRILAIVAIVAVVIALLLLAPGFFAGGPVASPTRSPSPSPTGPTATPSPTVTPQPTVSFETYVVQAGDSLSAIAVEFGLLPCQLQAANPEITNPNQIFIGQVIIIPPDDFALEECLETPAASP